MEQPSKLKFFRIHPRAILPVRATPLSAGLDISAIEAVRIEPNCRATFRTGLSVEIPPGFYGRIAPRSGLAIRFGLDVLAGVVDSDYRGEIMCVLINHGTEPATFEPGERIAQLIIECIASPSAEWADALTNTGRSDGGFGSSGP